MVDVSLIEYTRLMIEQRVVRRLSAIVAMDVAGYSRLMEANEVGTLGRLRAVRADVVDPELAGHDGRLVKATGDGLLIEFHSALDAVQFAVRVQENLAQREVDLPDTERFRFRIGIHVGDVIVENDDIFGDNVNIAARLEGLAKPGGIALSASVKEQIGGKIGLELTLAGQCKLKNIARTVSVWTCAPAADASAFPVAGLGSLPLPDKPSIAVLPFTDMSNETEDSFFADGITEDIITDLSRLDGFFVIARNSTFVYKGRSVDVKQVGRDLGVRYVLEGSLRRAGDKLRVNAQLIDTATGSHLWADRYDGPVNDIFAIQDRITESVVGCVAPELYAAEHERSRRKPPQNLDAWECWVQSLFQCAHQSKQSTGQSLELIDRAIALDPSYASPYGLRAWIYVWRAFQGWLPMDEAIASAQASIETAQAIDRDEVWSLLALAMIGFAIRDNTLSLQSAERALQFNPNMAYAHGMLAITHAFGGRPADALASVDHAVRLSPREMFAADYHLFYAFAHFAAGDNRACLGYALQSHRARPKHPYPIIMSMIAAAHVGDDPAAERYRRALLELVPELTVGQLRATCPFCLEAHIERFADGLLNSGMPE